MPKERSMQHAVEYQGASSPGSTSPAHAAARAQVLTRDRSQVDAFMPYAIAACSLCSLYLVLVRVEVIRVYETEPTITVIPKPFSVVTGGVTR